MAGDISDKWWGPQEEGCFQKEGKEFDGHAIVEALVVWEKLACNGQ
jgi:hypothetical protein